MRNCHDLNTKFNESEGKSDVAEAEKKYELVKEEYDSSEDEENGLFNNMEVDESKCDMIKNMNVFYSENDGIFATQQCTGYPNVFQAKQEVDSDERDEYEEYSQDSKSFVNEFIDPEAKVYNKDDVECSKIRISEFSQHLDPLNTVKSEPPDFGIQSDSHDRINERTDDSEGDIGDSKFFVQQDLNKERKLWDSKDTVSSKRIGITKCSQHATSEQIEIGMQSGCNEKINGITNVYEDEDEDSKSYINQYLGEEGKFFNNIDTISSKKEGAARELHEIELLEVSRSNLYSHMFDVHQKIYECPMCEFITGSNLQVHIDTVHLNFNQDKSQLCDDSSINSGNLKHRIDGVHLNVKKHKCNFCNYSTAKSSNLTCHVNSIHLKVKKEKKHKCHMCEYSSASRANLNSHIDTVHLKVKREKIHKCHLCDCSYTTANHLKLHINSVHLKMKKHKCHFCDYSTAYSGDLKSHTDSVHLKVKNHKCHLCDYSTAKKCHLNSHIDSVHIKVKMKKRYKCHLCDFTSTRRNSIKYHIDIVHLKVKKHKCHLCEFSSTKSHRVKFHIDCVHLKLRKHKCPLCDFTSSGSNHVKLHFDSVHLKVKKHKCHLCDYSTAYSGNLKAHIDRVHLKVNGH